MGTMSELPELEIEVNVFQPYIQILKEHTNVCKHDLFFKKIISVGAAIVVSSGHFDWAVMAFPISLASKPE